jgi:hypothetical protein
MNRENAGCKPRDFIYDPPDFLLFPEIVHDTLLEIRVLRGFFTNTYNKPYPKVFFKNRRGFSEREGFFEKPEGFFEKPLGCYMCW